jgi:hypothetical protein
MHRGCTTKNTTNLGFDGNAEETVNLHDPEWR